jgi:hypothetical protein
MLRAADYEDLDRELARFGLLAELFGQRREEGLHLHRFPLGRAASFRWTARE